MRFEYLLDVVAGFLSALVLLSGALLIILKIWKRRIETHEHRDICALRFIEGEKEQAFSLKKDEFRQAREVVGNLARLN